MLARALVISVLVACSRKPPPPPPPATGDGGQPLPPVVIADGAPPTPYRTDPNKNFVDASVTGKGKTFMVTSEAAAATKVGQEILAGGGNAVDAAVGVAFALAVVHPSAGNLGGGGFAVVRTGPKQAVAIDFRETAPAAATETMYLDKKTGKPTDASLVGHLAAGTPGSVAGLWALHQKHGKKPWKDVVTPAVKLARDGFAIDAVLAKSIEARADLLAKYPGSLAIWLPNRVAHAAGATVKIPELATTLQRIADKGADGFYKGETAAAIVAEMKRGGGIMTAKDLADYKPVWRDPLRFEYRGHSIVSMPPPSSGGIVLAMTAGMLKDTDLAKLAWHGTDHVHRLAEVWKRAFAARNELLGDPAYVKEMPVQKLLSPEYLAKLAKSITERATPSKDVASLLEGDHTTHLSVVDKTGMAVAMTTTLNTSFGSGVTVAGAGFLLNNEMDDFTAKPGSPNTFGLVQGVANKIEPGKRMLSSMSPTIVEDAKGELRIVAGAGGGPRIITAVWQTISNIIDYNLAVDAAVANPRVHHQHLPDKIRIEAEAIDELAATALTERGHDVDWSFSPREFGAITAIARTKDGWEGTSDRRGGGAAMGD